ncbi:HAMP domain-containing histidine kinase [Candidatus Sumerlaeota bacterium]|nr:HAMP domain-containing histidine kinase [Candidatus Sumerlaeota bacterium]
MVFSDVTASSATGVVHGVDPESHRAAIRQPRCNEPEVMLLDQQGRVCWMNESKRQRIGAERAQEILGTVCRDAAEVCFNNCTHCPFPHLGGSPGRREHWLTDPATKRPVQVFLWPVRRDDGCELVCIRHVAHAPRPTEGEVGNASLRQGMWVAMAALTHGLAHEMRNPLLALDMRLQAMMRRHDTGPCERDLGTLGEIQSVTRRMAGVVDQLCQFSPTERLTPVAIDPGQLIRTLLSEPSDRPEGVRVVVDDRRRGCIHVDETHLRTILEHLVSNAVDAMEGEGKLTITLTAERGWCFIDVSDTGCGIPATVRNRLGQPFVSTKPAGRGSGLGLSLCQLLADRHRGGLRVLRTGASGTTMRLSLPGCEPGRG